MGGIWKYGHSPLQKILRKIQYINLISSCIHYSIWQHTMRYPCRRNNAVPLTLSILNQNGILDGNANKKSLGIPIQHPFIMRKKTPFTKIKSQNLGLSENGVYHGIPPFFWWFLPGKMMVAHGFPFPVHRWLISLSSCSSSSSCHSSCWEPQMYSY